MVQKHCARYFPVAVLLTLVCHAAVCAAQQRIATGGAGRAAVLYGLGAAGLVASYAAVMCAATAAASRRRRMVLFAVPVVVQIGWLAQRPVLSIDAYSYLVDAAHVQQGLNPYEHAVREAGGTDLGRKLAAYGWHPSPGVSPYGPLWMNLIGVIGGVADDVPRGVAIVKLIAVVATTLTACLIYRTAPDSLRLSAFTAFWWNPVVIIEEAGEGHNDAVMVLAVVLSLWSLRRHATGVAAGALTAAVLTKWIPVFFAPAYIAYAWRQRLVTWRTASSTAAVVALLTYAAYFPLWAGANTFSGIRTLAAPRSVPSPIGVFVPFLAPHPGLYALVRVCTALPVLAAMLCAARTVQTRHDVIRTCATITLAYVLVAAPVYWPWYVIMPIALLALIGDMPLIIVLTAASRAVAALNLIRVHNGCSIRTEIWLTTVVALWLPLAYIGARAVTRRRNQSGE